MSKKLISEPHGTQANVLKRYVASQVNSLEAGNDTPSSILQLWEFHLDSGDCVAYGLSVEQRFDCKCNCKSFSFSCA